MSVVETIIAILVWLLPQASAVSFCKEYAAHKLPKHIKYFPAKILKEYMMLKVINEVKLNKMKLSKNIYIYISSNK